MSRSKFWILFSSSYSQNLSFGQRLFDRTEKSRPVVMLLYLKVASYTAKRIDNPIVKMNGPKNADTQFLLALTVIKGTGRGS